MRLLSPIIRVPVAVMDNIWHQLTMCNRIAPQFISNDLPGLFAMRLEQAPEERLGRGAIPSGVEPDCVADDVWRESVTFISINEPILPISAL